MGIELLAPYSSGKKLDPNPKRSAFLSRLRYRIDTVFSQLSGRYSIKAGVGARAVASGKQAAAQSPLSHRRLPAQPPTRQPTPPALEATHLKNPHIGLANPADTVLFLSDR